MTELNSINFDWQGLQAFDQVLKKQIENVEAVVKGGSSVVMGCEHPTVITLGKRSQNFSDVLIPLSDLRRQNIEIFSIDRGGHATLHNPGQLVIYPIIPLRRFNISVRNFVECLEISTAVFLAEHGLDVTRAYEPGLWVGDKKIAAFGIRIDRGVSYHGLAINVNNDLRSFNLIKQCGASTYATNMEVEMTEFMPEKPQFNLEEMARLWVGIFERNLNTLMGKPENHSQEKLLESLLT